jgi:DNA-binding transcriptional MocR family regulator
MRGVHDLLRLADALGDWTAGEGPRYARLADALASAVQRGLLDGGRLPAERRVAAHLGLSRATVTRAYALLRARGLVASRARAGTVVRAAGPRSPARTPLSPAIDRLIAGPGEAIDLSLGTQPLDGALAGLTVSLAEAAALAAPHGYAPQGAVALRAALAEHERARGVPSEPDELVITSGAQEALSLLATLLVGRGQAVLVEAPTYAGALEAFGQAGGRLVAVPGDAAGVRPDALRDRLARGPVALLHLMPGCQNPTGRALALGRRAALLALADEHDVPVVEDTVLDELRYAGPLRPTLAELAPGRVITIGSLSKLAWGGLRVGWIRAPRPLARRLARLKGSWDLGVPLLDQAIALAVLRDHAALAARRRAQARAGTAALVAALRRRLPAWEVEEPEGGLSLWVTLPAADGDLLAAAARRRGVLVSPGSAHGPGDACADGVRLCLPRPPGRAEEAARRLALAWADLREAGGPASRRWPAASDRP